MNIRTKLEAIVAHVATYDKKPKIEVYLNNHDYDDFQQEIADFYQSKVEKMESVISAYSSGEKAIQLNYMGAQIIVSRNIFTTGYAVSEIGEAGELFSRSSATFEKGYTGKEIILL